MFFNFRRGTIAYFLENLVRQLRNELDLELLKIPRRTEVEPEKSDFLAISLGIVSGLLGVLLIAGICFHIIKMRNYNRQIKSLSQAPFDPNAFNVKKLPTTNIYSKEKSNPAMVNADFNNLDLDTKSIISQDSDDFAGLENNPIFDISSKIDAPRNPLSQNDLEKPRKDSSTFA
jgi:hypothetical protein